MSITRTLLEDATATGAGSVVARTDKSYSTFLAKGNTSAGAGSATIDIEVTTEDNPVSADWIVAGTITLTLGTTQTADGFTMAARWPNVRANVTAISGTNASVTVVMGR